MVIRSFSRTIAEIFERCNTEAYQIFFTLYGPPYATSLDKIKGRHILPPKFKTRKSRTNC